MPRGNPPRRKARPGGLGCFQNRRRPSSPVAPAFDGAVNGRLIDAALCRDPPRLARRLLPLGLRTLGQLSFKNHPLLFIQRIDFPQNLLNTGHRDLRQ